MILFPHPTLHTHTLSLKAGKMTNTQEFGSIVLEQVLAGFPRSLKWFGVPLLCCCRHDTGMHILISNLFFFLFLFFLYFCAFCLELNHFTVHPTNEKGVRFDPDIPQTIRLEFAKSNTKVSKPKQQNSSPPAAAPHPTLLHPLTGREYLFCFSLSYRQFFFFLFLSSVFPRSQK